MKKQNIKTIVFLMILTILTSHSAFGFMPKDGVHELSVYGGGGLSSFRYKLPNASLSNGARFNFGVGYNYFINPKFGVHTGLGLGMYSTKVKLKDSEFISHNLIDDEGDRFNLYTMLYGYGENQKAMFLGIPIKIVYQTAVKKNPVYAMGGIKMGIPISGTYTATSSKIVNEFYYPDLHNSAKNYNPAGNGTYDDKKFEGNFELRTSWMLAFEVGTKINVSKDFPLYIGAFFDYGLNNVLREKNKPFINYNSADPANFSANLLSISDRANIISAGLTLRLHFDLKTVLSKNQRKKRNPYGPAQSQY
jgi:hypothetical protein